MPCSYSLGYWCYLVSEDADVVDWTMETMLLGYVDQNEVVLVWLKCCFMGHSNRHVRKDTLLRVDMRGHLLFHVYMITAVVPDMPWTAPACFRFHHAILGPQSTESEVRRTSVPRIAPQALHLNQPPSHTPRSLDWLTQRWPKWNGNSGCHQMWRC